jgi:hypothetical protein
MPRLLLHLALVLHELATNARKYGALSVAQGRLSVTWEVRTNGGENLILEWKESGGPPVSAPKRRGFGSTLIERTIHAQGGKASIRYGSEGLSARLRLPLRSGSSRTLEIYAALGEQPRKPCCSIQQRNRISTGNASSSLKMRHWCSWTWKRP